MTDIILHHYDTSPFSEKVRLVFGLKGLAWHSVVIPVIMPRPDLTPMTGGYRKTPVMQIGADIYCDTQIILRELERRFPQPSLTPRGNKGLAAMVGFWADRIFFMATVGLIFGDPDITVTEEFIKDREQFAGGRFDRAAMTAARPMMRDAVRAHLAMLNDQLEDGRPHLLGEPPSLVDVNAYMNVWFLRRWLKDGAALIDQCPRVATWEARLAAQGHGTRLELSSADALAIARAATPTTATQADPLEVNGRRPGDRVMIVPDDSGKIPVVGDLVASDAHSIAIRREDPAAGEVVVHFPRAGFLVVPA